MVPSIGIWGLCCYTIVTSYPFLNWQLRAAPPIPIIWASNTTANLTSKMGRLPTISHAPPINMKLGLSKVQTTNSKPPGQSEQRIWLINSRCLQQAFTSCAKKCWPKTILLPQTGMLFSSLCFVQNLLASLEQLQRWSVCLSHPSLVMYSCATPPIKLKPGQQIGGGRLINSKPAGRIMMMGQSETLSSSQIIFITLISASAQHCCAIYQPQQHAQLCGAKTISKPA